MKEGVLRELFSVWRERLGLGHWRLELIVGGVDEEDAYMQTHRSQTYERAQIYVQPWLVGQGEPNRDLLFAQNLEDDFIECSLVHELLHLHTRDMRAVVREDLAGAVLSDVYRQFENTMERAEEQCVGRLAEALVRAFRAIG